MDEQLPCTGERLVPQLQGDIAYEHLHRYALALQLCAGRVVLDIACGEGYGAHLMAQTAKEVIGVDLAPDVVKHASTTYRRNNLSFRVGDCCRLPVASSSLDLVVCFETLEHHDRHEEMLAEFKRVLKPDGILLVSTPEKSNYTDGTGHSNPFHVRELYRADFEALLRSHFAQTATFGQRMVRGSLVAPISGAISAAFATLTGNFSGITSEPGLSRPMYLLGLATDRGELPDPSVGIFEGNGLLEDFQLRAVSKEQEARVAAGEVSNRDAV